MSSSGVMTSSSGTGSSRKETERAKLIQEKCHTLLSQMLRDEDNKYCVDCDAKGPRWASWNLGVFLCIRCAGIHRNLGVHISRVKSVNLDTWTPEQVISLQQMGNSRARAVYEAQLPDGFRRPQTDTALESFIRAKYEHKKYLAREWVPPSPPKVDWAKEIDEELERQKRKKKAAHANSGLVGIGGGGGLLNAISGDDKKAAAGSSSGGGGGVKAVPLPAPLPKPKSNNSPKNPRNINATTALQNDNSQQHHSNDLLGLSSPTKPLQSQHNIGEQQLNSTGSGTVADLQNDTFSCFLSATPSSAVSVANNSGTETTAAVKRSTLIKEEEEDFFNQYNKHNNNGSSDKDTKTTTKLTKDNIMALYGQTATNPSIVTPVMGVYLQQQQHQHQQLLHHPQTQSAASLFGNTVAAAGLGVQYSSNLGVTAPLPGQQQQQQFMTPPNSVSMYNTPVMTAPAAFTGPPLTAGVHMVGGGPNLGFAAQFPTQIGFSPQQTPQGGLVASSVPPAIMNPTTVLSSGNNSMLYPGLAAASMMVAQQPQSAIASSTYNPLLMDGGGYGTTGSVLAATATSANTVVPTPTNTSNLQQQFSNLNIGNVWQ